MSNYLDGLQRKERITSVSGFPVGPPEQHAYLLVGITVIGRVVISNGDGQWVDVSPKSRKQEGG